MRPPSQPCVASPSSLAHPGGCRTLLLLAGLVALTASPGTGSAQTRHTLTGRVVERGTTAGLPGVPVALTGQASRLTDEEGRFRFEDLAPGRYILTVRGIGYTPAVVPVVVSGDTAVVVELDVAPVAMDTLRARAGEVRVRGRVRDPVLDDWLIDAEVFGTPDREDVTDGVGRFDLGDVPAGVPLTVMVRSFGYLPVTVTFEPSRDTTLVFELERDPVAQRMIAVQMERVDRRSEGLRYEPLPVLDRDDLMRRHSGLILDVLKLRLGTYMYRRIACIVLDENLVFRWRLATLHVDRIQRVEVTDFLTLGARALMVRIYTRDFVRKMVEGRGELVERRYIVKKVNRECR